jgi:hypothetical protein
MVNSSFGTLEALGAVLAKKIRDAPMWDGFRWQIRICLEKPTAITLADAACVEITVDSKSVSR